MQRWGGGHWGSNEGCGVWPRVADRLMNGSLGEFKRVGRRAGTNSWRLYFSLFFFPFMFFFFLKFKFVFNFFLTNVWGQNLGSESWMADYTAGCVIRGWRWRWRRGTLERYVWTHNIKDMERRNINANTCWLEYCFSNLCCFTVGLQVLLVDVSCLTWFQCTKYFVITILTAKICILQCYYNMFMTI